MEKIGYVYLTTNLVNGKQYVGQHLHDDFDAKYKGSGHYIKNAFEKYGWNNFDCKVICWCTTQTQLNEAEDNYIRLLNTMYPNGYNLKRGGSKGKNSDEARKNMSKSRRIYLKTENGKECRTKISNTLKKYYESEENRKKQSIATQKYFESEENRKKQSEAHKGQVAWNKGKKASKKSRKNMSEAQKNYFKDPKNREKHSKAHDKQKKRILQYTLDGVFVKEWDSLCEINRVLGFQSHPINNCCKGKLKYAYKSIWRYAYNTQLETFL